MFEIEIKFYGIYIIPLIIRDKEYHTID